MSSCELKEISNDFLLFLKGPKSNTEKIEAFVNFSEKIHKNFTSRLELVKSEAGKVLLVKGERNLNRLFWLMPFSHSEETEGLFLKEVNLLADKVKQVYKGVFTQIEEGFDPSKEELVKAYLQYWCTLITLGKTP